MNKFIPDPPSPELAYERRRIAGIEPGGPLYGPQRNRVKKGLKRTKGMSRRDAIHSVLSKLEIRNAERKSLKPKKYEFLP